MYVPLDDGAMDNIQASKEVVGQLTSFNQAISVAGVEEGSQFRGANQSTRKIFYGKKLNPMEDS